MDFNTKIKEKYAREVTPSFDEKNWNAFLAHRARKDKRPKALWFYLLGLSVVLLSTVYFLRNTNRSNFANQTGLTFGTSDIKAALSDERSTLPIIAAPETSVDLSQSTGQDTDRSFELEINERVPSSPRQVNKQTLVDHANLEAALIILEETSQEAKTGEKQEQDLTSVQVSQLGSGDTKDLYSTQVEPLSTSLNLLELPILFEGVKPIDIPSRRSNTWKSHTRTMQFYGGISFPFNVETVDEQAHQFGSKFYYDLGKRIRAKVGLEFGLISFRSTAINPAIGIDFVESPSDVVTFNNAIVESININWELGVDGLLFAKNNWQGYAGVSYLIAAELSKEIEYNFNGDDDNDSDDDVLLAVKNPEKYIVPHILKFEVGFQYETQIGGLNFSVAYPQQLSKIRQELLGQVQFNLGFARKF